MSLGIYSCMDTYGSRVLVLFDNPNNLCDGQPLMYIAADVDDDRYYSLKFNPGSDDRRCEYATPCTNSNNWRLIVPIEHLNVRHSIARDEGVLLTLLPVFFVGSVELEVVDAWLDNKEDRAAYTDMGFPKGHIVAEPFGKISADLLRPIILEHYDIALARLEELEGV